jgi:hypothetical protein
VIEEMAGSDRVPDPVDSKRAQVGNAQTIYESEMALFYECIQKCARKVLDTADIVRDRDFPPIDINRFRFAEQDEAAGVADAPLYHPTLVVTKMKSCRVSKK